MTVHLTAAQARALGIDTKGQPRTTRRTATGVAYRTRCHVCGETFTTQASEDRHLDANLGHHRYELIP